MANEPAKIDGGVFIDTKTDQVVHEKPEEGIQIVPEGGVLDSVAHGLLKAVAGEGAVDTVTSGVVQRPTVAQSDVVDFGSMKVDELKQYATDNDVDLGDATHKADIVAAIEAATENK